MSKPMNFFAFSGWHPSPKSYGIEVHFYPILTGNIGNADRGSTGGVEVLCLPVNPKCLNYNVTAN